MVKTTVYLPDQLKAALRKLAEQRQCSEADLLREAVARLTGGNDAPTPRLPLFRSTGESIAENIDAALDGFGTR